MFSHRKTQVEGFTHTRITSEFFGRQSLGWYVCSRENFAYLCFFANVFIPVKSKFLGKVEDILKVVQPCC